jgi:hypothetical protein
VDRIHRPSFAAPRDPEFVEPITSIALVKAPASTRQP